MKTAREILAWGRVLSLEWDTARKTDSKFLVFHAVALSGAAKRLFAWGKATVESKASKVHLSYVQQAGQVCSADLHHGLQPQGNTKLSDNAIHWFRISTPQRSAMGLKFYIKGNLNSASHSKEYFTMESKEFDYFSSISVSKAKMTPASLK